MAERLLLREGKMDQKVEGFVLPPLPVGDPRVARARRGSSLARDAGGVPCLICGSTVVEYDGKRICLQCGFMSGCSEGIERA
jgi:hypothetical protein